MASALSAFAAKARPRIADPVMVMALKREKLMVVMRGDRLCEAREGSVGLGNVGDAGRDGETRAEAFGGPVEPGVPYG